MSTKPLAYTAPLRAEVFQSFRGIAGIYRHPEGFGTVGSSRKDTNTERTGFRVSPQAKGRNSWSGQIVFRFEDFGDQQRMNTPLVVNSVNADIFCAIEVEGTEALRVFNRSVAARSVRTGVDVVWRTGGRQHSAVKHCAVARLN